MTKPTQNRFLFIPLASLILAILCTVCHAESLLGKPAPEFKVTVVGEKDTQLTLQDMKGHPFILEFWATWCQPCVQAKERLCELHEQFAEKGLKIVAVSDEENDVLQQYLKKNKIPFTVASDQTWKTHEAYGVNRLPHAVLVDEKGTVKWIGNPRSLRDDSIDQFLRAGKPPKTFVRAKNLPEEPATAPILTIDIALSSAKRRGSGVVSLSETETELYLKYTNMKIDAILRDLYDVSSSRLRCDETVLEYLYIITLNHCPRNGNRPDRKLLIDAILREIGLDVEERLPESDVWIAKHQGEAPPIGTGLPEASYDDKDRLQYRSTEFHYILQQAECTFSVLIEDETGLNKTYDIVIPMKLETFEEWRTYMASTYGMRFEKERRKTRIIEVRAKQTKQAAPGEAAPSPAGD